MASIHAAAVIFGCVFGGALMGIALQSVLPRHHLDSETKDLVKLCVGLVGTMAALVLGLLVASTKASYDTHRAEITQIAADTILLDRVLSQYGPEAADARATLRQAMARVVLGSAPGKAAGAQAEEGRAHAEVIFEKLSALTPHTDGQRALQAQAESLAISMGQTRWLLFAQRGSSISLPFMVVVVFWLTLLALSFGLFAPRNGTAVITLLVSALSVAGAIFLILELDQPFSGIMRISEEPLRNALMVLGQ